MIRLLFSFFSDGKRREKKQKRKKRERKDIIYVLVCLDVLSKKLLGGSSFFV